MACHALEHATHRRMLRRTAVQAASSYEEGNVATVAILFERPPQLVGAHEERHVSRVFEVCLANDPRLPD